MINVVSAKSYLVCSKYLLWRCLEMTLPENLLWQAGTSHFPIDPLEADESDLVMNSVCTFACLFSEYDVLPEKHDETAYMEAVFFSWRLCLRLCNWHENLWVHMPEEFWTIFIVTLVLVMLMKVKSWHLVTFWHLITLTFATKHCNKQCLPVQCTMLCWWSR